MKCVLFEMTYLKDDTRVWSNSKEFLDFTKSQDQPYADYPELPSYVNNLTDDDKLVTFCFSDDTKINLLFFWEDCTFDLTEMNNQSETFNFFHEHALKWKTSDSDVSVRSRKISNFETLYRRLYTTIWASYNTDVNYDEDFEQNNIIQNNITYSDLTELDSGFDDIVNLRLMVCFCRYVDNSNDVHHCFDVDDKQNWNLIESYVKSFIKDDNNVSEWHEENTFVLEDDTTS